MGELQIYYVGFQAVKTSKTVQKYELGFNKSIYKGSTLGIVHLPIVVYSNTYSCDISSRPLIIVHYSLPVYSCQYYIFMWYLLISCGIAQQRYLHISLGTCLLLSEGTAKKNVYLFMKENVVFCLKKHVYSCQKEYV